LTIIVNFFAGSGVGKSVLATDLFSKLKKLNIETEFKELLVNNNIKYESIASEEKYVNSISNDIKSEINWEKR